MNGYSNLGDAGGSGASMNDPYSAGLLAQSVADGAATDALIAEQNRRVMLLLGGAAVLFWLMWRAR